MAKSRAARKEHQTRTTKHTKDDTGTYTSNKFGVLELEEPNEGSPLLKLPREIRDQILDYVVSDAWFQASDFRHPYAIPTRVIADLGPFSLDGKPAPSMTLLRPSRTKVVSTPSYCVHLPRANRQLNAKVNDAVVRLLPHHICIRLVSQNYNGAPETSVDQLADNISPSIRRLYIQNLFKNHHAMTKGSMHRQLLQTDAIAKLGSCLQRYLALKELVLDLCGLVDEETRTSGRAELWLVKGLRWGQVPQEKTPPTFHSTVAGMMEGLPALQKYCLRTRGNATFGQRQGKEEWRRSFVVGSGMIDVDTVRESETRLPAKEMLQGMGIGISKGPVDHIIYNGVML